MLDFAEFTIQGTRLCCGGEQYLSHNSQKEKDKMKKKIYAVCAFFASSMAIGQIPGATSLSEADRAIYRSRAQEIFRQFGANVRPDEIVLQTVEADRVSADAGKYYAIIMRNDKSLRWISNRKLSSGISKGNAARRILTYDDTKWGRVAVASALQNWPAGNWQVQKLKREKGETIPQTGQSTASSNTVYVVLVGIQNKVPAQIDMTIDMVTGMIVNARCIPRRPR